MAERVIDEFQVRGGNKIQTLKIKVMNAIQRLENTVTICLQLTSYGNQVHPFTVSKGYVWNHFLSSFVTPKK